jgi:hypothetical protein
LFTIKLSRNPYDRRLGRGARSFPCSPAKYLENIVFARFKDRAGAVK